MERVLTAELRGKVEDVVTLAVDAADTRRLADDAEYKLVTLPVEPRPGREFASILRTAEETMAAVTIDADSPLAGQPVGALDVTVVAVRPADGPVEALPASDRRLSAGDSVYLVATPDAIRKVEGSLRPDEATVSSGSTMPADKRVDAATPVAGQSSDLARGTANTAVGSGASQTRGADASPAEESDASPAEEDDALDLGEPDLSDLDGGDGSTGSEESANAADDGPTDVESGTSNGEEESDPLSDWKTLDDAEPARDESTDRPGTDPDELTGADVDDLSDAGATDADGATTDADDGDGDNGSGETVTGEDSDGPDDDDVAVETDESGSDDEGSRDS